jgi:hypothetical protein
MSYLHLFIYFLCFVNICLAVQTRYVSAIFILLSMINQIPPIENLFIINGRNYVDIILAGLHYWYVLTFDELQ